MAKSLIYAKLKKVANDPRFSGQDLDINGRLCSVTGLPPVTVDNLTSNPDYYPPVEGAAQCNGDPNPYVLITETPLRQDIPDGMCDLIPYENFPLYIRNGGFYVNLGDTIYFKRGDTYWQYTPSNLEPDYSFTNYINYDEGNSRRYTLHIDPSSGNVLSKLACTPIFYNEEETRDYFKNDCILEGAGDVYEVTIPAREVSASTEEGVYEAVNFWFQANGQSMANANGSCLIDIVPTDVWVVTGSPCTGIRTKTTVYISKSTQVIYTNPSATTLFSGTFFPENNTLSKYVVVTGGNIQNSFDNVCPVISGVYYRDMGTPTAISVWGNKLLACYAEKQVVVVYNTSVATNPLGQVVAGELNRMAINQSSPDKWLCAPTLVEWREDGEKFVVYSGGNYKNLKVFSKTGTYLYEGAMSGYDGNNQWEYQTPTNPTDPVGTPVSSTSLVGMLGSASESNLWVVVGMDYRQKLTDDNYDTVFLNLWRKGSDGQNHFKLYAVAIMPPIYGQGLSLTSNVATQTGYAYNKTLGVNYSGDDVIRGMRVVKQTVINSRSTRYKLAVVVPRAKSRSGYAKYRYYDMYEVEVNINSIFNVVDYQPQIEPISFTDKGDFRIIDNTRGLSLNHVVAMCNETKGVLTITIKSSPQSFWDMIGKTIAVFALPSAIAAFGAIVGTVVDLIFGVACFAMPAFTVAMFAAVLIALLFAVFKRPGVARRVRSLAVTFNFSGLSTVSMIPSYGVLEQDMWIDADTSALGILSLDRSNPSSLTVYSLKDGYISRGDVRDRLSELVIS